jgi:hypothetical protein
MSADGEQRSHPRRIGPVPPVASCARASRSGGIRSHEMFAPVRMSIISTMPLGALAEPGRAAQHGSAARLRSVGGRGIRLIRTAAAYAERNRFRCPYSAQFTSSDQDETPR